MPADTTDAIGDRESPDNFIEIEGVQFIVDGPIVGASIAEFSAGLKIGKATYDDREHAFWLVLDDFSGGFAHRRLDVREELGTHFDNRGGVDLRRPNHITLPPKLFTNTASQQPTVTALFNGEQSAIASDKHEAAGLDYFGIYNSIYTLAYDTATGQRVSLTRQVAALTNFNRVNRVLEFTGSDKVRGIYVCGYGTTLINAHYYRNTTGNDVTKFDRAVISGAGVGEFNSGNTTYLSDMIVWNQQLVAQTADFLIISSADGQNWTPDATPAEDPIYRAGGFVRFIGVTISLWGPPAIYFIDQGKLFGLDFVKRTAYHIQDVGANNFLQAGVVWQGSIFITDGFNVWQYNPGTGETIRHLGPFSKDGVPPSWGERTYNIIHFLTGGKDLIAVCSSLDTSGSPRSGKMRLLIFNGIGWSWFGTEITGSLPYAGLVDRLPVNLATTVPSRFISVIAPNAQNDATSIRVFSWKLPPSSDIPFVSPPGSTPAQQTFYENGPLQWETGWIDGGFLDLEGVLFRIEFDGFNMSSDETCQVEYRIDNREEDVYKDLGVFQTAQGQLWFDDAHQGVDFRTVQFRFTLNRKTSSNEDATPAQLNSDTTIGDVWAVSPEVKSIILVYNKRPKLRMAWTIRIDVNRMVEASVDIQGESATYNNIWRVLKSFFNTNRLVRLVIPSVEPDGVNVLITDMPVTIDDFRDTVEGKGIIDLQIIEPITD